MRPDSVVDRRSPRMMMIMMMMIHASKKVRSSPLDTASRSHGLSLWRCERKA